MIPVTMPVVASTVALALAVLHAPPVVLLLRVTDEPGHMLNAVPVFAANELTTVTVVVVVQPVAAVYVINAEPADIPETTPVPEPTLAVPPAVLQVPPAVASVSDIERPTHTVDEEADIGLTAPNTFSDVVTKQPVVGV